MAKEYKIQGTVCDSVNEYNVGIALTKLDIDFKFQYEVGLRGIRGSQIVDFLVFLPPKPIPLFVHGRYWHTGTKAGEQKMKEAELNSMMRGRWAPVVIIWEEECETIDDAMVAVKKALGI